VDYQEVERLAGLGESETVEYKRGTGQLGSAAKSLCGFLNTAGGQVLIGVGSDGRILGQLVSDSTMQEIGNTLSRFEPAAPVDIERVALPDADLEVIVLSVPARSDLVPFTYDGRPYRRLGSSTERMPQEQYQQLLLQRAHGRHRWENRRAEGVKLADLDTEEILRTLRVGREAGRLPESTVGSAEEILEKLQLRVEGHLLNAAVALFGAFDTTPGLAADFPQSLLQMARFKGTSKTEFLDQRQLHGHCFKILDEAMLFLRRHLPVAGRIQPGLFERVDEPLFPVEALREALVNAVCHRDYALSGGSVRVAIYDDRLEIWSDGGLPPGIALEDLKRRHSSKPRNPLLADVLFRRGLIERWGRGTERIVELCLRAGHPEPEFLEEGGAVAVRFLPSGYIAPHSVTHNLTSRQREILQTLAGGEELPLRAILESLADPPSKRTVQKDLGLLRDLGLVDSLGWGQGARYRLVQS